MKAVFMGTPELAVPCLEATCAWADGQVRVVTQPDRPKGRSGTPQPSPVKLRATELGLEVYQPARLRRNRKAVEWLTAERPDVVVVVAFGQLLPPEVLAVPRLGCVNVHYSLLPKFRGAAPVQWALIRGETATGVTTMLMDEGLDTGPMLLRERVAIEPRETAGELAERLAQVAPEVLTKTLEEWSGGRVNPTRQEESAATWAPRLTPDDGRIEWSQPAVDIVDRIRGVTPQPGARAVLAGEEIKLLRASMAEVEAAPGELVAVTAGRGILVAASEGGVWLEVVQAPGRKAVPGESYAHGRRLAGGRAGRRVKES